jgi:hypothetical protein
MSFVPVCLYRAVKRPDGKVVCTDGDYLTQTCRAARTESDYLLMIGQGWVREPADALERFEAEEQAIGRVAAERAYVDNKMSEQAQEEMEAYEASVPGIQHITEIPEVAKKPRGRPKKVVLTDGDST